MVVEKSVINTSKNTLYCAMQHGCDEVVTDILRLHPSQFGFMQLKGDVGPFVLHIALHCTGIYGLY